MPPTTNYNFGNVVLVPFPFTDLNGNQETPGSNRQFRSLQ